MLSNAPLNANISLFHVLEQLISGIFYRKVSANFFPKDISKIEVFCGKRVEN